LKYIAAEEFLKETYSQNRAFPDTGFTYEMYLGVLKTQSHEVLQVPASADELSLWLDFRREELRSAQPRRLKN
jgi:hypothetical protein